MRLIGVSFTGFLTVFFGILLATSSSSARSTHEFEVIRLVSLSAVVDGCMEEMAKSLSIPPERSILRFNPDSFAIKSEVVASSKATLGNKGAFYLFG